MAQQSLLSFFSSTPTKKRKIDEVESTTENKDLKKEVQPTLENQPKRLKTDETPQKNPDIEDLPKIEDLKTEEPQPSKAPPPAVASTSNALPKTLTQNEITKSQPAPFLISTAGISESLKTQFPILKYFTEPGWIQALAPEFNKPYFKTLMQFVEKERTTATIYPPTELVFTAFNECPFKNVKVVILGQDPYINQRQAHGVSFSVPKGVTAPPSLLNIFKELKDDLGPQFNTPNHGYLLRWLRQGVLLLNAVLTVRAGASNSHQKQGWENVTDAAIRALNDKHKGLVFLLWGKPAQEKGKIIDTKKHRVLKAVHPSPMSAERGFFGCRHFSLTNEYLKSINKPIIDWNLDDPPIGIPAMPVNTPTKTPVTPVTPVKLVETSAKPVQTPVTGVTSNPANNDSKF